MGIASVGVDTLRPPSTLDKIMEFLGLPNPQAFPSMRRVQKEFAAHTILRIDDITLRGEYGEVSPTGNTTMTFKTRQGLRTKRLSFPVKSLERTSSTELKVRGMTEQQAQEYSRLLRAS